ncbi:MAG: hypothetical protein IJ449_12620 [Clostridia bacterium]|nr:hypothetical protein [Clostridia bacterium]
MMTLNGAWLCHITDSDTHDYTIPAAVPGCVHTDLKAAGILGDLYYRTNADDCRWVENCDVTYTKIFALTDDDIADNAVLVFDGLDTYCTVVLNGTVLGEADDMFIPWTFPAGQQLHAGENTLEVRFRSPIREVKDCPPRRGAFTTERINTRRIQCTYGWDWVARFVTMGIWHDVRLETPNVDRLEHIYVWTDSIHDGIDGALVAQVGVRAAFADVTCDGWVTVEISDPDGKTVFSRERRILPTAKGETSTVLSMFADIPAAKLWYPAGYGEQPLYTLTVKQNGNPIKTQKFGIRTAVILEVEDEPNSPAAEMAAKYKTYDQLIDWDRNEGSSSFVLLVNGVKIFCTGANWVPAEPFPSEETPEKLDALVKMARDGGYNMLRVWGGGIFEQAAFYDACDRYGVLVTQDFLMACGTYPEEDDAFIEKLKREARHAALTLRNHPSLVWWSGDNENAVSGDENMPHYPGRRAALEAIAPVLDALDPHRRFLPSSPYGGVPYASGVRGTSHNTQFLGNFFAWVREGNFDAYRTYFDRYLDRFCAEQPAMGMPYVSSLRRFMTEEDIFGDDVSVSEYHTKNNPGLGSVTLYGYVDRMARGVFGEYTSGEDRVYKMQLLHCEWVRLSMELFRRNAWYSSGIIYWMYNDCWPAANSWSMVDYYGGEKPAYYMFARCAKPLIGAISEEDGTVFVTVCHRGRETVSGNARLCCYNIKTGAETELAHLRFDNLSNESRVLYTPKMDSLNLDRETVLLLDTESTAGCDRAYFLPLAWKDMAFDGAPAYTVTESDTAFTVAAETTVPVLLLDVPYHLSENSMFVKRGETVVIQKL